MFNIGRAQFYQSKISKSAGTDYREVSKRAKKIYQELKRKTKRKPYIRSPYFNKEKVFLDYFWQHLHQKNSGLILPLGVL